MPVYNGERYLRRAVDSLLNQTFEDFELIISDNASDDGTEQICRDYAARDRRIQYCRNDRNLGSVANFNGVFYLANGEYFKWAGCDDWWEPRYLERCVKTLDEDAGVILVTCHERHLDDSGQWFNFEYDGFRASSSTPHERFAAMLRRQVTDPTYNVDLIYSVMRRRTLSRTGLFRPMLSTHLVLGLELSLLGRFRHIPEVLAYRRKHLLKSETEAIRWYVADGERYRARFVRFCLNVGRITLSAPVGRFQKVRCLIELVWYSARLSPKRLWMWGRRVVGLRSRLRAVRQAVSRRQSGRSPT